MQTLRTTLSLMACPDIACDILSYHFVREPAASRRLLVERSLEERYGVLTHELERLRAEA